MEGDGFDPCECLWSHNMAMHRLLSFLRQSQAYCTDTECFNELPGGDVQPSGQSFFFLLACGLICATLIMILRPKTNQRQEEDAVKIRYNDNGPRDNSSAPPPLC